MSKKVATGPNPTGTASAPERAEAMVAGTREFPPSSEGSPRDIARVRVAYAKASPPLGFVPPPAGLANKVKTAVKSMTGAKMALLMDKLGERLAFERTGVRLYEALLSHFEAEGPFRGGPEKADLEHILEEERRHFELVREAITQLGGDPTAVTPSANLHATASKGVGLVLVDPRTRLLEGLEAVLLAELADNEGWDSLVALARSAGEDDLAARLGEGQAAEREHLEKVRTWVAAGHERPRGVVTPTAPRRAEAPAPAKPRRKRRAPAKRRSGGRRRAA